MLCIIGEVYRRETYTQDDGGETWDSVESMETESVVEHDDDRDFLRLKRRNDGDRAEARRVERPEADDSSLPKRSGLRSLSGSMATFDGQHKTT